MSLGWCSFLAIFVLRFKCSIYLAGMVLIYVLPTYVGGAADVRTSKQKHMVTNLYIAHG